MAGRSDNPAAYILGEVIDRTVHVIAGLVNLVRHHPLGEQGVERLDGAGGQVAGDLHGAGKEPRIQQMQDRVFDPADILIDVHPIGGIGHVGGASRLRRGKAGVIPTAVHKRIHRVGFAQRRAVAFGAGGVPPGRVPVERVAGDAEIDIIGQFDGQVLFGLGHRAAGVAMHHRDRTAPVPLARQAPVAQAELGDALAHAVGLAKGNGGIDGLRAGLQNVACETFDILHLFGFRRHKCRRQRHVGLINRGEYRRDRQAVFGGKVVIPLIMRRAAKDRAGAVIHQDEVGDVDRQFPRGIKRMAHGQAGVEPQLVGLFQRLLGGAALAGLGTECGDGGVVRL